jgi:hypothetical protein
MEKRRDKRIPAHIEAKFFFGNTLCSGIVTNVSECGMCIDTKMFLPFDANIELLISLENEVLNVPVSVKRVVMTDSFYDTMGLEVLNQSREYLKLVENLRSSSNFR